MFFSRLLRPIAILAFLIYTAQAGLPASAQNTQREQISFANISVENGLSQSSAQSIIQDYLGFLWIGTKDGLNRYDGDNFTVYRHSESNKSSIKNNNIIAIQENNQGDLIVAFQSGGLNKYIRLDDSFTALGGNVFDNSQINTLYIDRSNIIWVATNKGLFVSDAAGKEFSLHVTPTKDPIPGFTVTGISEGMTNAVWLSSTNGLLKHDRQYNDCQLYKNPWGNYSPGANNLTAVCVLADGNVLVGTEEDGAFLFNPADNTFHPLEVSYDEPGTLLGQKITALLQDSNGFIWIGTDDQGLSIKHPRTPHARKFRDYDIHKGSLSNDRIRNLYEDRSGRIWVGTFVGGINMYDSHRSYFPSMSRQPGRTNSLINNSVRGFISQNPGSLWIATENGLDYWDRNANTFRHYQYESNNPYSINSNRCTSLSLDRDGTLWVSTIDGIARYDKENDRFMRLDLSYTGLGGDFRNSEVREVFKDSRGNFWYGLTNGLVFSDKKNGLHIGYKNDPKISTSLIGNNIYEIFEDSDGYIWISTTNGLSRFSYATGQFYNFQHNPDNPISISSNLVYTFFEDDSYIWMGTLNGGLNRYNKQNGEFKIFTAETGLSNDTIYGIIADDSGLLWLSTNNGLCVFDRQKESLVMSFGMKDGLQSQEFNNKAYYKSPEGEIFFGGINGFNYFFPHRIKINPMASPLVFTGIDINRAPVSTFNRYALTGEITLNYSQDHITFYFTTLDFATHGKRSYSYILEGYDKDWIATKTNNISYEKLPAGTYNLLIKGSNADGIWNENPITMRIHVQVPPWRTRWAMAAYVLIMCFFIRFIILRQRKKVLAVEENNRRLNEMIDEKTWELQLSMQVLDEKNKKLYFLTMHDELTGLFNRKRFSDVEDDFTKGIYSNRLPLCIIVGDVDGLKLINDHFGHTMGDEFLKKAAEIISCSLREGDIACRIGGDEFVLIIPSCDQVILQKIINRIVLEEDNYNSSLESKFFLHISLGYSFLDADNSFKNAFEAADEMMYENKKKEKEYTSQLIISKIEETKSRLDL